MGTRGLLLVRCCGRYYFYYNHLDSYPEGLGAAIVDKIPKDPEKYREWIETMRATYTRLSQHFEEDILCVTPKDDKPEGMDSPCGRYAKSFLAVDDRLQVPPLQTVLPDWENFDIEWTYTLDLDRELLAVDSAAYFNLPQLPHNKRWIEYLSEDRYNRRCLSKDTPQELIGNAAQEVEVNSVMRVHYRNMKVEFNISKIIHGLEKDRFFLQWTPSSFPFREIAFAILSVATGEVAFECPENLNISYQQEGYYLIPNQEDDKSQQGLLPRFLHECHVPGVEPGSAPQGTTFCLGNVLIYLTPRTDLVDVEEAAIAEVVEAGISQGKRSFRAIVFSILDVVLVQVQEKEGGNVQVIRSRLMNLFYFDDKNSQLPSGPRTRRERSPQPYETVSTDQADEEAMFHVNLDLTEPSPKGTFIMMVRFFDAAMKESLLGAKSQAFPNEILSAIMEFSDSQTYRTLAKVSPCCRDIYYRKFRLNEDYAVINIDAERGPGHFMLEHLRSGNKVNSEIHQQITGNYIKLSPVIGVSNPSRKSIIDNVSLVFSNIKSKGPVNQSKDMPIQHTSRYIQEVSGPRPEPSLFALPKYFYPGSVENAWGRYLLGVIKKSTMGRDDGFGLINSASFLCLLPHGYRELTLDYSCNGLHVFFRHACDESPEEWEKTTSYAVQQLHLREAFTDQKFKSKIRRPVIVAFTRKVKLFYYVHHCAEKASLPETARAHCFEIAERCTDADPRRRLVPLLPESGPLDLDDKESRELFESWIEVFCKVKDPLAEHKPFT